MIFWLSEQLKECSARYQWKELPELMVVFFTFKYKPLETFPVVDPGEGPGGAHPHPSYF